MVASCQKRDRHAKKGRGLVCGYPLPCPHHTWVIDLAKNSVTMPPEATAVSTKAIRRIDEVMDALSGFGEGANNDDYIC